MYELRIAYIVQHGARGGSPPPPPPAAPAGRPSSDNAYPRGPSIIKAAAGRPLRTDHLRDWGLESGWPLSERGAALMRRGGGLVSNVPRDAPAALALQPAPSHGCKVGTTPQQSEARVDRMAGRRQIGTPGKKRALESDWEHHHGGLYLERSPATLRLPEAVRGSRTGNGRVYDERARCANKARLAPLGVHLARELDADLIIRRLKLIRVI
mmetsp:Transcript_7756/g.25421  ORF Transcript_7756/g.25421 Transcript_7756/m.25421 type:complete len:211 (-) Transcript_7756:1016-1648(-)